VVVKEDAMLNSKRTATTAFWIVTTLFCLQIGFTAYAQLRLPQVAAAFTHLGFPDYFRVQLSWAKLLGLGLLLSPVPPRLKEWVYAGFAFDLGAAVIAHLSVGDGPQAWGWPLGTGVLWGLSYLLWRRLQAAPRDIQVGQQAVASFAGQSRSTAPQPQSQTPSS
jgi:hypothetical protein